MQVTTMSGGFYWLIYTIKVHGHLSTPVALIIFLIFISFYGIRFPVFALISKYIIKRKKISRLIVYPLVYTSVEFLFPDIFPFFLANSQHNNHYFIQIADITGVYGITFALVLIGAFIYDLFKRLRNKEKPDMKNTLAAVAVLILFFSYGIIRSNIIENKIAAGKTLTVGFIQPNTPFLSTIRIREQNIIRKNVFALSENLLSKNKVDILIWPESAAQFAFKSFYYKNTFRTPIEEMVRKHKIFFLFSDIDVVFSGRNRLGQKVEIAPDANNLYSKLRKLKKIEKTYYTTAVLLDKNANIIGNYRKKHLLPFGEYMPLGKSLPFLKKYFEEVSDFSAGEGAEVFKTKKGIFAPSICYELILPSYTREFVKKGAEVLLNITNDAWFGNTKASLQHLSLAKFRAIENRIPIVRSTNSGISAFISANGRITSDITRLNSVTSMVHTVKLIKERTFYTLYGNVFAYIILFCFLFVFFLSVFISFKNERKIFFIRIK
jgi:apolipoprotein N-acyltransferase